MPRIPGKVFDATLRFQQSESEYRANKSKAGSIGGTMSKLPKKVALRNGEALGLSNFKNKTIEMGVSCRESIGKYQAGKRYVLTIETGVNTPLIVAPYEYQFKNWIEFLKYFKRYAMVK